MKIEIIADVKNELGEGPVWVDGRFHWVNITVGTLNWLDDDGQVKSHNIGQMLGAAAPCKDGRWLLARHHGLSFLDLKTGQQQEIVDPEKERKTRFNDGKTDPAGRFFAGTLSFDSTPNNCALYRYDPSGKLEKVFSNVGLSNGLAWSSDRQHMYYNDTRNKTMYRFDYCLETGEINNAVKFVDWTGKPGNLDGMDIDENDNLWVCLWGAKCVVQINGKTGQEMQRVEMPCTQTSSCCFGGKNLDELWFTSARIGLSQETLTKEPHAGGIFKIKPGVRGRAVNLFS